MRGPKWLAAAAVVVAATTACASPRSSLNTAGGACFRALAAAGDTVHQKGSLVGVKRLQVADLVARVPEAASLGHREACGVAYKADYKPGDVIGASPTSSGHYALVLVDSSQQVLAAYVLDQLPVRFSHRI